MIQETIVEMSAATVMLDYKIDPSLKDDLEPSSFLSLFRFADTIDKVLMGFGVLCAIGNGVALPFLAYPYGRLTQAFAPNTSNDLIVNEVKQAYISFLINSVVIFLMSWFMFSSWMITSERQSIKCRKEYFAALLRQEIGWYDRSKVEEIASNAYLYATNLQNAIGQKVSKVFMTISMGLAGFIIAFIQGWKLSIVITCVIPFLLVAGFFNNHYLKQATDFISRINSKAQGMAEEVLLSVKTVKTLSGERFQSRNFSQQIAKSTTKAIRYGFVRSTMSSLFFFSIIMTYTIGFWYGSALVGASQINDNTKQVYNVADVVVIFFCIYMSGLNLGQLPQSIKNFAVGRKSAAKIFSVLDRSPKIQSGLFFPPKQIKSIRFQNVEFFYQVPLFQNLTLQIHPGKVAFVGGSGSGKSTILNLLMRFYDPISGKILMTSTQSSIDWKDLDLNQLRSDIGYVGQQPVLIGSTIRQAISGNSYEEDDIIKALKLAEAWDFVRSIGLDSSFGGLSGGQKQRIAIARALIKRPKILILDQATSALDRKNQKQIQSTLDKLKVQFMIVVAHKIQTIKSSDVIYVLEKGSLVEKGDYVTLMAKKGRFYQLAAGQQRQDQQTDYKEVTQSELGESRLFDVSRKSFMEVRPRKTTLQLNAAGVKAMEITDFQNGKQKNQGKQQDKKQEEDAGKQFNCMLFWRMLMYNKQYLWLIIIGLVASGFTGTVFPLFSSFLSKIVVILSAIKYSPPDTVKKYETEAFNLAITLFIISCCSLLTHFFKTSSFMYVAQRLSFSLKKDVYNKLLNLPMSYHDGKQGKQTATILSGDCHVVNSLTSNLLSDIFENATTLIVGLVIAFVNCWQITLVALALIPVLLLAGKLQMSFAVGTSSEAEYKRSHQIVQTGIVNIKTVLAFNMQEDLKRSYSQLLQQPMKIAIRRGNISGLMYGLSQMAITCILALIFFIGSIFIQKYNMDILGIFTAIYAIMFAAIQAGGQLQFIPNIGALKIAAVNIFKVLDQKDELQVNGLESKYSMKQIRGDIELQEVTFKYETRENNVFEHISLKIPAGKRVALVGSSGCGKSTILQLILRLYNPAEGKILLDGVDISTVNLAALRSQLGVVSQEPVLFNRSIIQNIKYNKQDVTDEDVVDACKQANALKFVTDANFGLDENQSALEDNLTNKLPDGFYKKVGLKGGFLSGGQKQRIAIARAIVRKPKILLLDEATSALDTQNQQQVQQAIDSITGMTTIIVAHRLSTIQKCDIIFVFDQGQIVEQGSYEQLLELRGFFYRLANGIQEKSKRRKTLFEMNNLANQTSHVS